MGFGNSDLTAVKTIWDILRWIFSAFDKPVYGLLTLVYQLFFKVASAEIFSSKMVSSFYGRIQLIIGVFMMFQLAMIIIKGIMNPDNFTDKKSGAGNVITRIMLSLFMLTLIVPINIPNPANEYEENISRNGLLFGTLYSLQNRILENNTIAKLILGVKGDNQNHVKNPNDLESSANRFASYIIKIFYRVNLVPEYDSIDECKNAAEPGKLKNCRLCKTSSSDDAVEAYYEDDISPQAIIYMVNEACDDGLGKRTLDFLAKVTKKVTFGYVDATGLTKEPHYVFVFTPLLSTIVGIGMIIILISFTIDVAVRAVKIAVLRLIAPIPIISYMDPNGSKDSAFNAWVKTLSTTYLSLFLRLAVVFFILSLVQELIEGNIILKSGGGILGGFTAICIFIGLFAFAKQAPKFFREALGIKDNGGKFFSGLGEIMGAGALVGGTVGSMHAARTASMMADLTNGKDPAALHNRLKHGISGLAGGITGAYTGFTAAAGAKDHQGKAVFDAMQKRNATAMARGASGSTFFGRTRANISRAFQGEGATSFDAQTRAISQLKDIEKSGKDLFSYLEGKGKTDGAGWNVTTASFDGQANGVDFTGRRFTGTLNELQSAKQKAIADQQAGRGNGTFVFDGMVFKTTDASVTKLEEELGYAAGHEWATREEAKQARWDAARAANPTWTDEDLTRAGYKQADVGYSQKRDTYNENVKYADKIDNIASNIADTYSTSGGPNTVNVSNLKKRFKYAGGQSVRRESAADYKRQQQDYNATKKN